MAKQATPETNETNETPETPEQADLHTAASFAVETMRGALSSLSRANGAVWKALRDAAGFFSATMTPDDRAVLYQDLRDAYAAHGLENCKVLASQHARGIFYIATKAQGKDGKVVDPTKFKSLSAYISNFAEPKAPKTPAAPASAGHADAGNAPKNDAPVPNADAALIGPALTGGMLSMHGLRPETADVFRDLVRMVREDPQFEAAVTLLRNMPAKAREWATMVLTDEAKARADKLATKFGADKVKVGKAPAGAQPLKAAA